VKYCIRSFFGVIDGQCDKQHDSIADYHIEVKVV